MANSLEKHIGRGNLANSLHLQNKVYNIYVHSWLYAAKLE